MNHRDLVDTSFRSQFKPGWLTFRAPPSGDGEIDMLMDVQDLT